MTGIGLGELLFSLEQQLSFADHWKSNEALQKLQIQGVRRDSRAVEAGDLYVAIAKSREQADAFAIQALARGAVAFASEFELAIDAPLIRVADARRFLALASSMVAGDPTAKLKTIGITGTNGKTTVAWIVAAALDSLGAHCGLAGTIELRGPGFRRPSPLTTLESDDLARFASELVERGATHLAMEVSSHALVQKRVDGCAFAVSAFTNLSQDHLDFHGTMENYFQAKALLFRNFKKPSWSPPAKVVCIDDEWGQRLHQEVGGISVSSVNKDADLWCETLQVGGHGTDLRVHSRGKSFDLQHSLVGDHNVKNFAVAWGILEALGFAQEEIARGMSRSELPPGRLERVASRKLERPSQHPETNRAGEPSVYVDYAHTPGALEHVTASLRKATKGRLIVVFGCGGDRDRGKRPEMAHAVEANADIAILTNDNPRSEDPQAIADEVALGFKDADEVFKAELLARPGSASAKAIYCIELDRKSAIELAVRIALPEDLVLIAGKGHEPYQEIAGVRWPFDDREAVREVLQKRNIAWRK